MVGGVFFKVGRRQIEQCDRRAQPVFLQMHERAGKLDQALVVGVVGTMPVSEPEFLQHIVRFKVEAAIEALEIAGVVRAPAPAGAARDQFRDFPALLAHARSIGA